MKIIILLALCLCGCEAPQERMGRLLYLKDARTDQCYASYHLGQESGALTNVPCSDLVLKAIEEDKQVARTPVL